MPCVLSHALTCCDLARSAELQLLPPILYQLLLLSGSGARPFALKGLMALFDHLEAQPQHKTGDAPSAVLLQVGSMTPHTRPSVMYHMM